MNEQTVTIDAATCLYGIIGRPVRHSLSPVMHNAAFCRLGINGVYLAFDTDDTARACMSMRCLGIKGYSVTIPNKERIISELDEPDETVLRIGACNTVKNSAGRLFGTNTDWIGAVKAIEKKMDIAGKTAVILGAGGSARAVIYGLKKSGVDVTICNRTVEKAEKLAKEFNCKAAGIGHAEKIRADILINTTPVGMGSLSGTSPVSGQGVMNYGLVMDIVYSPPVTRLLQYAMNAGRAAINGLEMLLVQAMAQFEYWTGRPAPEETMKKALEYAISHETH